MKESGAYVICSFMGEAVFRCRFGLLKHQFREPHLPQQGNGIAGIGRALHKAVEKCMPCSVSSSRKCTWHSFSAGG